MTVKFFDGYKSTTTGLDLNNLLDINTQSTLVPDASGTLWNNSAFAPKTGDPLSTGLNPASGSGYQTSSPFANWANIAQGVGSLANTYLGFKSLGLQKDAFNFQKGIATTNLANQANLTNERLATRQATRVADNSNAMSVSEYMKKYGVSGKLGG